MDEYDDKADRELVISDMTQDPKANKTRVKIKGSDEVFEVDQLFWSHDGYEVQENGYFAPKGDKFVDQNQLFQKFGT